MTKRIVSPSVPLPPPPAAVVESPARYTVWPATWPTSARAKGIIDVHMLERDYYVPRLVRFFCLSVEQKHPVL
jgi:hypothetical protein